MEMTQINELEQKMEKLITDDASIGDVMNVATIMLVKAIYQIGPMNITAQQMFDKISSFVERTIEENRQKK